MDSKTNRDEQPDAENLATEKSFEENSSDTNLSQEKVIEHQDFPTFLNGQFLPGKCSTDLH